MRIWRTVDFADPADHRVKVKGSEKRDKYLDLSRVLRKLYIMRVMVIPIVIDALGTIPKGLDRELEELETEGRIEMIQATVLLRSTRILRTVQESRGDLLSLRLK